MSWSLTALTTGADISSSGDANSLDNDLFTDDGAGSNVTGVISDFSLSGKVYFEWTFLGAGTELNHAKVGIANSSWDPTATTQLGSDGSGNSVANLIYETPTKANAKVKLGAITDLRTGNSADDIGSIFMVAFDVSTGDVWFGEGGSWLEGDPGAGTGASLNLSGSTFYVGATLFQGDTKDITIQSFLNEAVQTYSPPSGFSAAAADPPPTAKPGPDNLAISGKAPTANLIEVSTTQPGVDSLTVSGKAPEIEVGKIAVVYPGVDSITLAGKAPTTALAIRFTSQPSEDNLTLTGKAPSLTVGVITIVTPGVAHLWLPSMAPTVEVSTTKAPGKTSLVLSGKAPTVFIAYPFSADITLPGVVAEAAAYFGVVFSADVELPPMEADFLTGYQGDVQLPDVRAGPSSLWVGRIFSGDATLPATVVEATASLSQNFTANIALPSMQGEGTWLSGRIFSADFDLPVVTADGVFYKTTALSGDLTLPAIVADSGVLLGGLFFAGEAELRAVEIEATFSNAETLTYWGLSTNSFNLGHTHYVNTDYDGIGRLGTNAYAAMSDGLYRLDGEDDAGITVEAYFLTGYEDFGNEAVKAQRVAYLGYSSDGPMELMVRADTDGAELFTYPVEDPHTTAENDSPARIKLGRGLRGRYWQTGLRNCDGSDFRIDRMGLGVWTSTRKR